MPAQAGIQKTRKTLDSGLRRNDEKMAAAGFSIFEIGSNKM
ncbi:MAG: hypothetical protein R3F42_08925 [Pseudomonadota bacterium]